MNLLVSIWVIPWYIVLFLFQLVVTILGWVLVPLGMLFMEPFKPTNAGSKDYKFQKKFKWRLFDAIYGNSEDGIADVGYTQKYPTPYEPTWWRTYNWLAWRNPIHNLALKMGVDDLIVLYKWIGNPNTEDRIGREGFVFSVAISGSGKKYYMYRWCKLFYKDYGIEMNIGYKNFNIEVNDLPKHYKYSFTISVNPFKKFEPAR